MNRVQTIGRRKKAQARAVISNGRGMVRVNKENVHSLSNYLRLKISEPLILAGNPKDIDINVKADGGGVAGQADAIRTAIARGLIEHYPKKRLKDVFLQYDRSLLVEDSRRTEPHKPSQSSKGPRHKRQKSYR